MSCKYSVVIVSYNCKSSLQKCIDSVQKYSGSTLELIVVDNNSNDGTSDLLKSRTGIKSILNPENIGFSRACNLGSQHAEGNYLVFLNPDTETTPGWLEKLENYFGDPKVGAVGPVSNYVAGAQKYELYSDSEFSQGNSPQSIALSLEAKNRGRGVITKLLIGFCLMIRREVFRELQGMDEELFLGNDDLDLCWRLREKGFKLVVATDVFVFHEGQKSFQTEANRKTSRLVQESTDALYKKLVNYYGGVQNLPSSEEIWGMNWFKPSPEAVKQLELRPPSQEPDAAEDVAWVIYVPPELESPSPLNRTIESIPASFAEETIILNHNCRAQLHYSQLPGTKLDINPDIPVKKALNKGFNLVEGRYVIFCFAGVEYSKFFGLSWHKFLGAFTPIPVKITRDITENASGPINLPAAFIGTKDRMLQRITGARKLDPISSIFPHDPAESPTAEMEVPTLKYSGPVLKEPYERERVHHCQDLISQYPDSLSRHMGESDSVAFTGADLAAVLNPKGQEVPLDSQNLLIMRVAPEMLEQLPGVLKEVYRKAASLKKLIMVYIPPDDDGPNADLKSATDLSLQSSLAGIKNSAWYSGYSVEEVEVYSGVATGHKIRRETGPGNTESDSPSFLRRPEGIPTGGQVICRPRSQQHSYDTVVSIIILGFNQVDFSRKCIESIQAHTRQNYELILIDNGSEDGTGEYFNSVAGATVIINERNLGVAKGWNQGLKIARGDYLLIFNNDTIVSPGWLSNMVRLAECDSSIGIVGPRSNNISGPQLIQDTEIKTETDISAFSEKWQTAHDLSAFEFERVTGFCMLISRDVFKKVGYFDERFGKGNFEDDDYCLRARYLGFKLLVANDSFVFHFGSVSFSNQSVDWQHLMRENARKFRDKWQQGAKALSNTEGDFQGQKVLDLVRQAVEAYGKNDIIRAQELYFSALDIDKQIPEVYNGLGIIAFHQGSYEDSLSLFRKALELDPDDEDTARNAVDVLEKSCTPEDIIKCINAFLIDFPRNPVLANELQKRTGPQKRETAHWKAHVEELITQKRYSEALDILERILRSGNELAFCYNYMGIIAFECQDPKMAWDHFNKSLEMNLLDEDVLVNFCDAGITLGKKGEVLSTLAKVFSYPGKSAGFNEIKQYYEQLKLEAQSGSWDPDKIIYSREMNISGENLIREGMFDKARDIFNKLLEGDQKNFRACNNLGLIAWYKNDFKTAWENFTKALIINPLYPDALINAFDASLRLKEVESYREYLDRALEMDPRNREAQEILNQIVERGASIYEVQNFEAIDTANEKLEEADKFMREGRINEAIVSYLEAIEKKSDGYSAYNGLGLIAFKKKMFKDSFRLFQTAVELNPLDEPSLMNLWENSQILGKQPEVIDRLVAAVQIDPSLHQIKAVVDSYSP